MKNEIEYHGDQVRKARKMYLVARQMMDVEIMAAHNCGISNRKIAEWMGLTEAAVRLRLKRREERGEVCQPVSYPCSDSSSASSTTSGLRRVR